ncbi:acid sphingomyelinase-like phosphodiesterase 3b [Saccoglossus kowalevskii]|uniref:Sphingomyelinase phosphodiesterase n=1 Tax=Saccoglossus kowalevskii TaxID=10224 RepID=A0ABM0GMU4_SACKO|nr:PREDICTED: acid sphingomyelinase-like phosphodiesterase 3b-like [Saccoglossus kowalevskii]
MYVGAQSGIYAVLLFVYLSTHIRAQTVAMEDVGYFWHVADFHYDYQYSMRGDPTYYCHYWNETTAKDLGYYGDYECDSPMSLVVSAVQAMKANKPDVDFIVWTGDDAPHVPDAMVGEELMIEIIANLTQVITDIFPDTRVYPAIANHDYDPSNQLPVQTSRQYNAIADAWSGWLNHDSDAVASLRKAAYYTTVMENDVRLIVPNTNLYYTSNKVTAGMPDPAGQFDWMENTLEEAKRNNQLVWILAHIPPGHPERSHSSPWFYEEFNERYIDIISQYADIIIGQFYAHHHTDHFKVLYNDNGEPISSMLLAPAVVPWRNKYVYNAEFGANNPAVRLFKYQRSTGKLLDIMQYIMNLSEANQNNSPEWVLEYTATEAYSIDDVTTESLHELAESFKPENSENFEKYNLYCSASYDVTPCDETCKQMQMCAITNIRVSDYDACMESTTSASSRASFNTITLFITSFWFVVTIS